MRRLRRAGGPWHQLPHMAERPKGESFRIADVRRPEVRGGRPPSKTPPPARSMGFPAIEAWLEEGAIEEVIEAIRPRYEALEQMAGAGTPREKAGAKKAMIAYERAADLLEYLFDTKERLKGGR